MQKLRNRFYVYELKDGRDGSVFYVGKGKIDLRDGYARKLRYYAHLHDAKAGSQFRVHRKIRKIWREGGEILFEAILETPSEKHAYNEERRLIAFYGRDVLTNLTEGGDGAHHHPDTKAKISVMKRGKKRPPFSDEWRTNLGLASRRAHTMLSQKKRIARNQAIAQNKKKMWDELPSLEREARIRKLHEFWEDPVKTRQMIEKMSASKRGKYPPHLKKLWRDPQSKSVAIAHHKQTLQAKYERMSPAEKKAVAARVIEAGAKLWGSMSPEQRSAHAKQRFSRMTRTQKAAQIAQFRNASERFWANAENRRKIAEKISATLMGRTLSPEHRAKLKAGGHEAALKAWATKRKKQAEAMRMNVSP
jgi:LEM-3-like GIY-YIG domain